MAHKQLLFNSVAREKVLVRVALENVAPVAGVLLLTEVPEPMEARREFEPSSN